MVGIYKSKIDGPHMLNCHLRSFLAYRSGTRRIPILPWLETFWFLPHSATFHSKLITRIYNDYKKCFFFAVGQSTSTYMGRLYSGIWSRLQLVFARPIIQHWLLEISNVLSEVNIWPEEVGKNWNYNLEFVLMMKDLMIFLFSST